MYLFKIPTELNDKLIPITKIDVDNYTLCKESESMYGGGFELCADIVCYWDENSKSEIVVPYYGGEADQRYGFREVHNIDSIFLREKEILIKSSSMYFI